MLVQKPLLAFRAGRCVHERSGASKLRIRADPRRGEVRLVRSPEGMINVQWRDRTTGNMEINLECFPDDVTFKRIRTGREEDRVYELNFVSAADRRFFFWMQEPAVEKDAENARKLVETVNNPAGACFVALI